MPESILLWKDTNWQWWILVKAHQHRDPLHRQCMLLLHGSQVQEGGAFRSGFVLFAGGHQGSGVVVLARVHQEEGPGSCCRGHQEA